MADVGWAGVVKVGMEGGVCSGLSSKASRRPLLHPGQAERKGRLLLYQPLPCARSFRPTSLLILTTSYE